MNNVLIESLKKSAMFQLSLGSKELFHSNFLYWIWNISSNLFKDILNGLLGAEHQIVLPDDFVVKREHKNFDLCVENSHTDIILVIENKVKSIPTYKQLREYKTDDSVTYLLLSLAEEFPEKKRIIDLGWVYANYESLSAIIKDLVEHKSYADLSDYHRAIILDYCEFIRTLHHIQSEWIIDDDTPFFIADREYENLRIKDLKEKIRFSKMCIILAEKLKRRLNRDIVFGNKELMFSSEYNDLSQKVIFVNFGMTRTLGLVEAKILIRKDVALLIQVQGDQYRHGIELYESRRTHDKNWEYWSGNESVSWFFRQKNNPQPFIPFELSESTSEIRPKNKEYNKFKDEFLYHAITIPSKTTVGEVLDMIVADCERIITHEGKSL